MRVFVTGGSGLIGSAVIAELLGNGHTVLGLARSEESAAGLQAAGAQPVRGDLADLDAIRSGAADADGAVHLAFGADFSSAESVARSIGEDRAAQLAIGEVFAGSDRPFVTNSGTPWLAGQVSTEATPLDLDGPVGGRARTVTAVLALADRGVRTSAVRLPRTVHNHGRGGFAGLLTAHARQTGTAAYPGDGTQRWPAVHAADAAALFRLALESAPAGTAWHAVDEEGVAVGDIAAVIGRRLELPTGQVSEDAFGALGHIFAIDQPSSSEYTRATLDWHPTHPDLLTDLENIEA